MNASRKSISYGMRKSKCFFRALQTANRNHFPAVATQPTETGTRKPFSEIPGPRRLPLMGNLHLFSKFGPYNIEKLYDAYTDLHKTYGPIVRLEMGMPLILLFDPEDILILMNLDRIMPQRPLFKALRHYRLEEKKGRYSCAGLVAENGEEWLRLRRALNFMLHPSFSKTYYFRSHEKVADDFVARIGNIKDSNGLIPDFLQEIFRFTQEAIGVVCFGTRLGLLDSSNSDLSNEITAATHDLLEALAETLLQPEYWKLFKTPIYKKLVKSHDFFHNLASECIKKAETKMKDPEYKYDPTSEFLVNLLNKETLTSSDIILLMVEMFSAGIDTTGSTIGFTLYHLAKNPETQEKLHEEIVEHSKNGWNEEFSTSMRYLKACIKESYRLNPATGGSARILTGTAVFSGYEVPSGTTCLGLHPVISRLEEHFEAPLQYRPERWLQEGSNLLARTGHPYCSLPFGHGMRRCVGQRFGEQEIKLCILKIIEKFRVEYNGPDVGTIMRLSLIPDKPLNFKFIER